MSQPDAALYIQVPTFETTVAIQMIAKARCRKGAREEAARSEAPPLPRSISVIPPTTGVHRRQRMRATSSAFTRDGAAPNRAVT